MRGPGIPTQALEEVMGRSLGSRGPGFRGSSPYCAAAVRCPVPAGLSKAPGPAASSPPPSALPRLDPAPPRPAVPPAGPRPLLVQARAFKNFGLLTQPQGLSPDWPALPSRGPRKEPESSWRPGQRGRDQKGDGDGGEPERKSAAHHRCASLPRPGKRGGEEGRALSSQGTSAPSGVVGPWHPAKGVGGGGSRKPFSSPAM